MSDREPTPEQWSERYAGGSTPWDLGRGHPELVARLADGRLSGSGPALVPGAGRGHDAVALAKGGWTVTALDFAPSLDRVLADRMERVGGSAVIADAFAYQGGPFDLVFDHTFFCTIDPSSRPRFGPMVDSLTRVGSRLVSVVFPVGRSHSEPSPPWGVTVEDVSDALGPDWRLEVDEPATNPPGRGWSARWAEWVRRQREA